MSPLTPPSRVKNPWRTRGLSESRSTAINVLSLLWLPNGNSRTGASEAGFLKPRRHGLPGTGDRQRLEQGAHRRRFDQAAEGRIRSEEHTSELQSLMRNSYAVFCLKTKN